MARKAFADGIAQGRGGKGSIYIFASGNGGSNDNCNGDGYANAVYTIAISAVDEYGNKPYYSEPCRCYNSAHFGCFIVNTRTL